jgi:hypothetical protein
MRSGSPKVFRDRRESVRTGFVALSRLEYIQIASGCHARSRQSGTLLFVDNSYESLAGLCRAEKISKNKI